MAKATQYPDLKLLSRERVTYSTLFDYALAWHTPLRVIEKVLKSEGLMWDDGTPSEKALEANYATYAEGEWLWARPLFYKRHGNLQARAQGHPDALTPKLEPLVRRALEVLQETERSIAAYQKSRRLSQAQRRKLTKNAISLFLMTVPERFWDRVMAQAERIHSEQRRSLTPRSIRLRPLIAE